MGNAAAQQALEELAEAARRGDTVAVQDFLQSVAAARASEAPSDKQSRALRKLDLDAAVLDGGKASVLQVAAASACPEVVRCLLDAHLLDPRVPQLNPDARNSANRTALHSAVACVAPPRCAQVVADLIARRADPCIADDEGLTPLDLARRCRCVLCVRTIEDKVGLWSGWVNHDECKRFVPKWTSRWMVLLKDRHANTGRGGGWPKAAEVSCYRCQSVLKFPPYVFKVRCRCQAETKLPPSLQIALYDSNISTGNASAADAALQAAGRADPAALVRLPLSMQRIQATNLDEAGIQSSWDALTQGKLRKLLQNAQGTACAFGIRLKVQQNAGVAPVENCLRVATEADRQRLLAIFQNPILAAASEALPVATTVPAAGSLAVAQATQYQFGKLVDADFHPLLGPDPTVSSSGAAAAWPARASLPAGMAPPVPSCQPSAPPEDGGHGEGEGEGGSCCSSVPALLDAAAAAPAAAAPPLSTTEAGDNQVADNELCVICMDAFATTAVIPCGHLCGCERCLQALRGSQAADCPICRGPITNTIRIYKG